MTDDRNIIAAVIFNDADDLRSALDELIEKSGELGDIFPSIESGSGFALQGVAALIEISEGSNSYTIDLLDEKDGAAAIAKVDAS